MLIVIWFLGSLNLAAAQTPQEKWALVEQLRIGSVDGPNALSAVSALSLSPDRRHIYVAQPRDYALLMFDASSGKYVRRIGQRGMGPGEFHAINWLSWRGDTLCIADKNQHRMAMFSAAGQHLRTERLESPPLPATRKPALPVAIAPNGSVWAESEIDMMMIAKGLTSSAPIVLLSRQGKITRIPAERDVSNTMQFAAIGSGVAIFKQPMSDRSYRSFAPDGSSLIVVDIPPATDADARFFVTRISFTGDTLYRRNYRYSPVHVSASMRDSLYVAYAKTFEGRGTPAQALQAAKAHVTIPSMQPAVSGVIVDWNGSSWLKGEDLGNNGVRWLVLSPEGLPRATLNLSRGITIRAVDGATVWGVVEAELGVPYVVRYRTQRVN
jgi:hypothetical protein